MSNRRSPQDDGDHPRQKRRRVEDVDEDSHGPPPPTPTVANFPGHQLEWEEIEIQFDLPHEESPPPAATSSSPIVPTAPASPDDPSQADHPVVVDDQPASSSNTAAAEPLSAYTCPICFSPPTNATLTPCGHVCCGQCLFTAVKATIRRNMVISMDGPPPARCPVCRAEIPGWDGHGGGVIGLNVHILYSL